MSYIYGYQKRNIQIKYVALMTENYFPVHVGSHSNLNLSI